DRSTTEEYILCVSTLHPHKNLERLLRAYARAGLNQRLVLAGMFGSRADAIRSLARSLGLNGSVEFTGWIPREQLYRLYQKAPSFIYPSSFEGFGMPLLEAMAAGIPMACSAIPPLREIAGDAALFFDPADEDAISEALKRITNDQSLRRRLS